MTTLYGLPEKVIFCDQCVMSNQRPQSTVEMLSDGNQKKGLGFEDGVCDACRYGEVKKTIDWGKREKHFMSFLDRYRSNSNSFDCVVPSSGGKDSSFTAHKLKYKYGMNPLAVTWAPNMWTDVGFKNFDSLSRVGGVDSLLVTPNGRLHRHLTKLAFQNLGHPFQPFIHGQKVIGPKIAANLGIKLVVYGENQAEYGNDVSDNQSPFMSSDFFTLNDYKQMKFGGISVAKILEEEPQFSLSDFSCYVPMTKQELKASEVTMTYLGYFEKWDPQEVYYYAEENTGFQPADQRSEGTYSRYTEIDDKIVPIHFYTTFIKFGLGRASYDAAQEIRNGHIDRDEAISLVRKYDGEKPKLWLQDFLDYVGLKEQEFDHIIDSLRPDHLWDRVGNQFQLRHPVS